MNDGLYRLVVHGELKGKVGRARGRLTASVGALKLGVVEFQNMEDGLLADVFIECRDRLENLELVVELDPESHLRLGGYELMRRFL